MRSALRVSVVLALVLIVGSAVWSLLQGNSGGSSYAEDAAQRAEVVAEGLPPQRSATAALVALAGDRLAPSPTAELGMLEVALENAGVERRIETGADRVTAAIRLRHLLLTAGDDQELRVWRPVTETLIGAVRSPRPLVSLAEAFGLPLAVGADKTGTLTLVDLSDPHHPRLRQLPESSGRGRALTTTFSADGEEVRVVRPGGELETFATRGGRRLGAVDLGEQAELLLGERSLGRLELAQFETSDYAAPNQVLLGFTSGAVVRSDLGGGAVKLLIPPGFAPGALTSFAAEPVGGEVAVGTQAGLITLEHPGSSPEIHGGPQVAGVAFDSEDDLMVARPEGVERRSEGFPLEGIAGGEPATALSAGIGGVVALYRDGAVSLLGPTSTGVELQGYVYGPALAFLPGGNLVVAEGASPDQTTDLEVVLPGHEMLDGFPVDEPEVRSFKPSPHWWSQEEAEESGLGLYINDIVADREFVAAGGQDPTGEAAVLVWNTHTGKPIRRLPLATAGLNPNEPSIVADVALIPTKHVLAAYSAAQQLVAIWSTESWKLVASVPVGRASDIAISPDESTLAVVAPVHEVDPTELQLGPSKLTFIDTADGSIDHEVKVAEAERIAFSPDGHSLALAAGNGTLRILSADGRGELRSPIHLDAEPLAIAWRPDGGLIAVSLENGGVALVNPQTGRVSSRLPGEDGSAFALSWSPDGRLLADVPGSQGDDGAYEPETAEVWAIGDARLQRRMCQLAGGPMGRGEWRSTIGGGPYRRLCHPHRVAMTAAPERKIVLGAATFEINGSGWGTAEPSKIYNGGDASGTVSDIHWQHWGSSTAYGVGRTSIFKPSGGYYPQLVPIRLRAHGLGHCALEPAYTKLSVRVPSRPHGPFSKWGSWSGASSLCGPPTY